MPVNAELAINGFQLILTSEREPEQYDVYKKAKLVGYIRLRHGKLTVNAPKSDGVLVYSGSPQGQGEFLKVERDFYLRQAIYAIQKHYRKESKNAR